MQNGRQRPVSSWTTSARILAATVLSFACAFVVGYFTHELWHRDDARDWIATALTALAVLGVLPVAIIAQLHALRLRRSEARFAGFFEHTSNPIVLMDLHGNRVVDANARAAELFDCTREELLGRSWQALFAQDAQATAAFLDRVRIEGSAWDERLRCRTGSGAVVQAQATATLSPGDDNRLLLRLRNMDQQRSMEHAVFSLAQLSSALEDEEFYRACVRDLASTYGCRWAFTGVFSDAKRTSITTIAFWDGSDFRDNVTYPLTGTPCADVFAGCLSKVPRGAAQRYRNDSMLAQMGVESYMATALVNQRGEATGIVVVMDPQPMHGGRFSETLLGVYANRLATELERRKAVQDLRDSEMNYRDLVDGSAQGIIIHRDWQALYVNPRFLTMFGYQSLDEVRGLSSLRALFEPDELAMLERFREARMRGESVPDAYEVRALRKDGTSMEMLNVVRLITWNGEQAIQSTCLDVTESKKVQAALRGSEENFRRLADGSLEGIVIHRDFRPLYVNPAFAGMFGYTAEALLALPDMQVLFAEHARKRVRDIGVSCLQSDTSPSVCTTEMRHSDGHPVEVQMRTTRTQWNGERAVQTTLIDITEQREAEWILHSLHDFSSQQDLGFEARTQALLGAGCLYFDLPIGILTRLSDQTFEIMSAVTPEETFTAGERFPLADTFCGFTIGTHKAAVYPDVVEAGLGNHPCHRKFGMRTYVGIPLHVRGSFYGTLVFASQEPRERPFKRSEVRILELMGRWVAGEIARQLDERDRVDSEQRFRDFAETSADWFWETDRNMRFTLVHGRFQEVTGIDARQILGTTREALYERYVANIADINARYAIAAAAHKPFTETQLIWKRSDGQQRILSNSAKPMFDSNGEFVGYRGAGRDVTEQMLAQEAVKRSEQRFRDFASTAADWFWETDSALRFTYISENHARIVGRDNAEFLGRSRLEAYRDTLSSNMPDWHQHVADVRARRPYALKIELTRSDGSLLIIYDQGNPLLDSDGSFLGYRGIGRDITHRVLTERELEKHQHSLEERVNERTRELKAAQKELLQQERLATIGRLVATVSHELRNPLGAVRNAAYYLKRKTPHQEPRWLEQLAIIDKEINAADKIISDLLETTRAKVPVVQDIDLESLVRQVFESCRSDLDIEFRYASDPPDLQLAADKDHLRQVLLNLVTNSVHALRQGGSILVSARQDAAQSSIWVRDDGPGIPDEYHEHIFEPLFTTKSKGNGLGLWISREIVERHGGSLKLVTRPRSGAWFAITLPHAPSAGSTLAAAS